MILINNRIINSEITKYFDPLIRDLKMRTSTNIFPMFLNLYRFMESVCYLKYTNKNEGTLLLPPYSLFSAYSSHPLSNYSHDRNQYIRLLSQENTQQSLEKKEASPSVKLVKTMMSPSYNFSKLNPN